MTSPPSPPFSSSSPSPPPLPSDEGFLKFGQGMGGLWEEGMVIEYPSCSSSLCFFPFGDKARKRGGCVCKKGEGEGGEEGEGEGEREREGEGEGEGKGKGKGKGEGEGEGEGRVKEVVRGLWSDAATSCIIVVAVGGSDKERKAVFVHADEEVLLLHFFSFCQLVFEQEEIELHAVGGMDTLDNNSKNIGSQMTKFFFENCEKTTLKIIFSNLSLNNPPPSSPTALYIDFFPSSPSSPSSPPSSPSPSFPFSSPSPSSPLSSVYSSSSPLFPSPPVRPGRDGPLQMAYFFYDGGFWLNLKHIDPYTSFSLICDELSKSGKLQPFLRSLTQYKNMTDEELRNNSTTPKDEPPEFFTGMRVTGAYAEMLLNFYN